MENSTLIPVSDIQLQHWIEKLKAAEVPYDIQTQAGKAVLVVSAEAAESVLGIPQKEAPKPRPVWFKYAMGAIVGLALLIFVPPYLMGAFSDPVPVKTLDQMNDAELKEHYTNEYGIKGDWVWHYSLWVKKEFVNYPETFTVTDASVFPIDRDSLTHVLHFKAANAFGVEKQHSITSVISSGGELLRVVNQQ